MLVIGGDRAKGRDGVRTDSMMPGITGPPRKLEDVECVLNGEYGPRACPERT
ncbi:MAG: hypothetical protein ACRDWG_17215 [Actinomycetes bacterium]